MPRLESVSPAIVIANGFDRYHLLAAAAEVHRHGRLERCIAGFYPTAALTHRLESFGLMRWPRLARLKDRAVALPDERIRALALAEALGHASTRLLGPRGMLAARRVFSRQAAAVLSTSGAKLYHCRSGFGHTSALAAKRRSMVVLADHSIAHPAVLGHLVENQGHLPAKGQESALGVLWADVLADLAQADAILVNSDFVKATFLHQGADPRNIHVVYQGLDDAFFRLMPPDRRSEPQMTAPLRLAFAGAFETRKGADHLALALATLGDIPWTLELIGPVDEAVRARHAGFLEDPRVTLAGRVDRRELARRLADAEVFLFPSLAEGSARVVFEALASGCYVITTANSGSIVEDGVHGALVPPDQPHITAAALRLAHADRLRVLAIGGQNRALIEERYRQRHYGEALITLYDRLLAGRAGIAKRKAA